MKFTKKDAMKIADVLGVAPDFGRKDSYIFSIRKTTLEIYPSIRIGKKKGTLVAVYTPHTYMQLHFCTGYIASELLGEVTFFGEHNGKISGLIVEKNGACSFYANLDKELLHSDFTKLEPEIMIPSVALSLGELLIEKRPRKK